MAIRYIMAPVTFCIEPVKQVEFKIQKPRTLLFDFGNLEVNVHEKYPIYDGEYVVTPRTWGQVLETDEKLMDGNVTILQIPADYVENLMDGYTVSIG